MRQEKVIILGSGPAGLTAALYAARSGLSPLVIRGPEPGGQLTTTTDVENFPGFSKVVQGPWLMDEMESQARHVGTAFAEDIITQVVPDQNSAQGKLLCVGKSLSYACHALIIATGASAKWLGLPAESRFRGYGVSSCAVCDAFFFKGKDVAVIGGGNTAVEDALYLSHHAKTVTLIHRRDTLRAEKILQERLFQKSNQIRILWNSHLEDILGEESPKKVTGIQVSSQGKSLLLEVQGVFVAIGHRPNTGFLKGVLPMDPEGYLKGHPDSTVTDVPGIFVAGDVRDKVYRQAVTAAGQGCMAALDAHRYLLHQGYI